MKTSSWMLLITTSRCWLTTYLLTPTVLLTTRWRKTFSWCWFAFWTRFPWLSLEIRDNPRRWLSIFWLGTWRDSLPILIWWNKSLRLTPSFTKATPRLCQWMFYTFWRRPKTVWIITKNLNRKTQFRRLLLLFSMKSESWNWAMITP